MSRWGTKTVTVSSAAILIQPAEQLAFGARGQRLGLRSIEPTQAR